MLSLDDQRWKELNHRGWTGGARYDLDPDAPFVPDELAQLLQVPSDLKRFRSLWPYLCSEGTAWAAAYAAVPYAVELARHVERAQRFEYLYFVGLVVMCSCPEQGDSFAIQPYLEESYLRALAETLPLLAEVLEAALDVQETRHLLAAVAALKGHVNLGRVLDRLECISGKCPRCGELVFPEELQQGLSD